jgi:hypothetical protein
MLTSSQIGSAGPSAVPMSLIYTFPRRSLDCALGSSLYAPECVEVEFCELPLYGVLRR